MDDFNLNNDDNLSVIPYDSNREVVLRHNDSIVVFDPQSKQLILRNRDRGIDSRPTTETSCPHCGRRYDRDNSSAVEDDFAEEQQPSFINSQYFRLLARSTPGSRQPSVPPSPRRRLARPVSSSLDTTVDEPPSDAEFIGSVPAPPDETHGISESAFAPQYFEKFFTVEKELGRGGRGVVLLVKHVLDKVTLGYFACKRVPVGDDHAWLEKVLVEVQALQSLSHQNLVSYRHVWLEDYQINNFSPSVPCAFILQQYCNGGDLHTYVCAPAQVQSTTQELKERLRRRSRGETEMPRKLNEPRRLHLDEIYGFFMNITEGLRFLHLNGFIHRDLKPSNCLLHRVGGETRVLVSDFGEVQYENTIRKSTGATGTISYCAPEVLKPVSPGGPLGNFTFKSDIFSLGMILHFLCFADLPYRNADVLHEEQEDIRELREEIMSWIGFDESIKMRTDLPSKLYTFLRKLLAISPEDRPSSDDILQQLKPANIDMPELKRRSSMGIEELTPGKRITKVDSPASTNSNKNVRPKDIDTMSPTRQMRLRGPRSPSITHARPGSSEQEEQFGFGPNDRKGSTSSLQALAMTRSSSHGAHNHHPPASISTNTKSNLTTATARSPSPHSPARHISPSPERKRQLLLPAPQPTSPPERARQILAQEVTTPTFYILLFAAKIMSMIQPCLNHGINTSLFYVVFALAVVELAIQPHPIWRLLLLMAVHIGVLWYAYEHDMWCRVMTGWEIES